MSIQCEFSSQCGKSPDQADDPSNVLRGLNFYVEKENVAKVATAPTKSSLERHLFEMVKLTEQESVKIVKDLRLYMKDGIFTAERIQTKLKQECIQDELRGMMDIEDV